MFSNYIIKNFHDEVRCTSPITTHLISCSGNIHPEAHSLCPWQSIWPVENTSWISCTTGISDLLCMLHGQEEKGHLEMPGRLDPLLHDYKYKHNFSFLHLYWHGALEGGKMLFWLVALFLCKMQCRAVFQVTTHPSLRKLMFLSTYAGLAD